MDELSEELFNILKGANYKLRLFTGEGVKTLQPKEATRFYAYDQDLMVTLRKELESLKALYTHPTKELKTVMKWLDKRIKKIEEKMNDS